MSFTITLKKKNPNNKDLLICCPALVSWQLALFSQGVEEKLLKREPGASLGLPSGEDPVFSSRGGMGSIPGWTKLGRTLSEKP